jgi:hypothetical protein
MLLHGKMFGRDLGHITKLLQLKETNPRQQDRVRELAAIEKLCLIEIKKPISS